MHPWCFLRGSFSHHGSVTGAAGTTGALVHMLTLRVCWTADPPFWAKFSINDHFAQVFEKARSCA
jgi:hypothetical protein